MTFGAPLGLLALLAVPAIIAAYFLRRRQPPRTVSALFLWRTPEQRAEAGPRLQRFSRERSLLLELLAVLFAALFLADVRCGEAATKQHVVIILDGSLSMSAEGVADKAKTEVARLAHAENAGVLTLVESGLKPSLLAGPQLETDRALAALEKWEPAQPAHDFATAFTLARELAGSRDRKVFFITDAPVENVPDFIDGRSVGVARDNLAFLSAQRHDERGVDVHLHAQAAAGLARAVGVVEREHARGHLGQRDAALDARELVGEDLRLRPLDVDHQHALGEAQGGFDGIGKPAADIVLHDQAIDHDLDVVLLILVERDVGREVAQFAVDAHAHVALLLQVAELFAVLALAPAHDGREHLDL